MASRAGERLECGRLCVRFAWSQDRFAHELQAFDGRAWHSLLASIEGTPDDVWPLSPPLQSLHVEQRSAGPVALLVGMAGKCHWSASFELDVPAERIRVGVACRVREAQGKELGSCYRVAALGSDGLPASRNDAAMIPVPRFPPALQHWLVVRSVDACRLHPTSGALVLRPAASITDAVQTVQWTYEVGLERGQ